ncbi:DUF1080 domain-containing protein [Chloroflexia bacterium SDU3-3]|nr:DUF1080 domain-containing protein [Chloroflexia bacterium SDU3-3]
MTIARKARHVFLVGIIGALALATQALPLQAQSSTLLSDTFEDGNADGWATTGGSWSVVTDGSKVYQQSTVSGQSRSLAGSSWADQTVEAKVKPLSFSGGSEYVGVIARAQSATSFYTLIIRNANKIELRRISSGSTNTLTSVSFTVDTNTWYTLRLQVQGSTLTGYVNGTKYVTATDSQYASGQVGLVTYNGTASFDDVSVTGAGGTTPTTVPTSTPTKTSTPVPGTATPTRTATPVTPTTVATATAIPATPVPGSAIYAAPNGSDSAAGTISAPTTLTSAITRVAAGGIIYLRGGTYSYATPVMIERGNNGTSSARKQLFAYPGETPILDFSAMAELSTNRGLSVNGSYWHVKGLIVQRAGDNGVFVGGNNNIIERVVTRYNRDTGLQLGRYVSTAAYADWPANNLIVSCESHDNADSDGEDADGFAAKLTVGPGNIFRYDVSHNNIDDGWDLYTKSDTGAIGAVTIENSIAYNNGTLSDGSTAGNGDRNGFKLGGEDIGVNHIIRNNLAYHNGKHGFTWNRNTGSIQMTSNVAVDSGERNFTFEGGSSVFKGNLSCRTSSGSNDKIVGTDAGSNAWWMGSNASACSSYTGSFSWSFNSDGSLSYSFK